METVGDGTDPGSRTPGQDAGGGPVRSGEGARSALEQLLQQSKRREAQLPRDDGEPPEPRPPAPAP